MWTLRRLIAPANPSASVAYIWERGRPREICRTGRALLSICGVAIFLVAGASQRSVPLGTNHGNNKSQARCSEVTSFLLHFIDRLSHCWHVDVAMPDRAREARRLYGVHLGAGPSKRDPQNGSSFALHLRCCHIPSCRGIRKEHASGDKPWQQQHVSEQ